MRKIVSGLFISLDGVIDEPHEWHFPYFNDEMGEAVGSSMMAADCMLLGRITWQGFAGYWPDKTEDEVQMADYMNNTPKFVVSTTLDSVDEWQNSTLVKGDFVEEITNLKEQEGGNIGVTGSAHLVRSLLHHNLLDELHLLVHPIVIGSGKKLFPDGTEQTPLKLLNSKTFSTGVMHLVYGKDEGQKE